MKIVFIVGASRSGTTMLNRILGGHDQILALNELQYFGDLWQPANKTDELPVNELRKIAAKLFARHHHDFWGGPPTEDDRRHASTIVEQLENNERNGKDLFYRFLEQIAQENHKSIVSEQTPRNIFYAAQLLDMYPNAYVIHLIRDPRAVLASQKGRWRRKFLGGENTPWAEIVRVWINYHPITMCNLWKKATLTGLSLATHPRFMRLRFEDMVSQPQTQIKTICDFLKIDYQTDMENIPRAGSSSRPNEPNVRGVSAEALGSWKKQLTPGESAICEYITGPLMERFNYQTITRQLPIISVLLSLTKFPFHLLGVTLTNPKRAWIQLRAYITR